MSDHHKPVSHNGDSTGLGDKKLRTTENIHIDGEVTIDFPVDVKNENANAKRESDRKEQRKFWLDVATLAVVTVYAALTGYQAREMRQAVTAAKDQNHLLAESTRGRAELDFSLQSPPATGKKYRSRLYDQKHWSHAHIL